MCKQKQEQEEQQEVSFSLPTSSDKRWRTVSEIAEEVCEKSSLATLRATFSHAKTYTRHRAASFYRPDVKWSREHLLLARTFTCRRVSCGENKSENEARSKRLTVGLIDDVYGAGRYQWNLYKHKSRCGDVHIFCAVAIAVDPPKSNGKERTRVL